MVLLISADGFSMSIGNYLSRRNSKEFIEKEGYNKELTHYLMFKMLLKQRLQGKEYDRRLKKFFDFIKYWNWDLKVIY